VVTSEAARGDVDAPAVERPSYLTVGTIVWLSSELMFFVALFAAAYTLRAESEGPWPPPDVDLNVVLASVLTALLVASSVTQHAAAKAVERGDLVGLRRWMSATVALGAVFVAGQAFEWSELDFSVSSHPFGSAFYTLTGFHGLHVIGGVLALAVVLGRSTQPGFAVNGRASVDMVTSYWHFVDVVWIAVFGSLYLLS
jgi:cytochrome c oxidase subunit III